MTIFDRAKLAVQLSLDNYDKFLDAKAKVEAAYHAVSYMAEIYKPVFAADAASALSDDELTEQLESAFSVTQEQGVYGSRFDLAKIREAIAWVVANKELIALLIKFL
jgi:hypothetical protein